MTKSVWSLVLVLIGLFMMIEPFSSLNWPLITNWYGFLAGFVVYIIGLITVIVAFRAKETGFFKYLTVASLVAVIGWFCVMATFIGTV